MTLPLITLLALQATVIAQRPVDVVRQATRAIEADSVAPAVARWQSMLARDSADPTALLGLATIARLRYDYPTAERQYATIANRSRTTRDAFDAWAALGRAESRLYRAPFDSALTWFRTARALARTVGDSVAAAYAMHGAAVVQTRVGLPGVAVAIADSALRVGGQDVASRAQGRCVRAIALWSQGDARFGAEAAAGLALARQAGQARLEAACLTTLGQHSLTIGNHGRATAMFDTAIAVAGKARDRATAATAVWWRGNHRLELYEHDDAQRDLSSALAEATASGNNFVAGFAWLRLAVVSWHFGDMESARRDLERARRMLTDIGDAWGLGYVRSLDGAMALDAGQLDIADVAFRDQLAWADRLGEPLSRFTALFGLARVSMSRRDWSGARTRFDEAAVVARRHELTGYLPQLEYEYALIALRAGDLAVAERGFRTVLAAKSGVTDLDSYAARSRIAEIHLARGDIGKAERELTDATDALDSLRAALGGRELRVLAFQARKGYDDNDLGFATIIDRLAMAGRAEAALALAERRRARELRDRLVRNDASLTSASRVPGASGDWRSSAVAHALDDRTAMIEYVTGTGSQPTTLFVLSRQGTRAFRRPPADSIAADALAFAGLVEAGAGVETLARTLGHAVFGTALDSLPSSVTRLVIIADGPLHRLPFDALRMRDGRTVLERFAVSLAPSIGVVAELLARAPPRVGPARILALGDPRFANEVSAGNGSAADVYREAFATNGGLPRLPGSAKEAQRVARFAARSELRLRERASEQFLKSVALDSFDVIHLATHALVDDRSAARTALAVADGGDDDGFVGPGELSALRIDARLVVLSACRTARGVAVRGEGVQGLTAPLLATGARSVLATQWRIRDRDAVQFIEDFYRALAAGRTVGDAARAAKLAAVRRGATPATWAAFTVVGDPSVTVPLSLPPDPRRWLSVIGAVGMAIVLYGLMRIRRAGDRSSVPSASRAMTPQ